MRQRRFGRKIFKAWWRDVHSFILSITSHVSHSGTMKHTCMWEKGRAMRMRVRLFHLQPSHDCKPPQTFWRVRVIKANNSPLKLPLDWNSGKEKKAGMATTALTQKKTIWFHFLYSTHPKIFLIRKCQLLLWNKTKKQNKTYCTNILSYLHHFFFLYQCSSRKQSIPKRNHKGQLLNVEHDVGVGRREGFDCLLIGSGKIAGHKAQVDIIAYLCWALKKGSRGSIFLLATTLFSFLFLLPWYASYGASSRGDKIQPT